MLQIMMLGAAWLAIRGGSHLVAASIAIAQGYIIVRRVAHVADRLHMLAVERTVMKSAFDRRPSRRERQALRADMRAVIDYTLFTSLLPGIAQGLRRFRSGLPR